MVGTSVICVDSTYCTECTSTHAYLCFVNSASWRAFEIEMMARST